MGLPDPSSRSMNWWIAHHLHDPQLQLRTQEAQIELLKDRIAELEMMQSREVQRAPYQALITRANLRLAAPVGYLHTLDE